MSRFAFMNNPYRVIKLFAFVTGVCMVSCTTALSQQSLFVYLQTENWQPFYVQIGDRVYSSSAIGHLVISGLPDNTCNFEVGFPQHATQPQRFSVPLRNKDHGYQIVKTGSRGWALHDLQTEETIKPLKEVGNNSLLYGERKKDDAFATLMAAVVNDSAVLYTSIVKKEEVTAPAVATNTNEKPSEKQPVVKTEEKAVQPVVDTAVIVKNVEAVTVINPPPADTASLVKTEAVPRDTAQLTKYDPKEKGLSEKPEQPKGAVVKIQHQTKDGEIKMVFVDSSDSPASVVTVYITEEKKAVEDKPVTPTQAPAQPLRDSATATQIAKTETKQEPVVAKDSVKTVVAPPPAKKEVVETARKEEPVSRETAKSAPALSKEEVAEQIKKETWRSAAEKKTSKTDTVTIILESRQMKSGVTAAEEPVKPLYRPKQEKQPEPIKPATPDTTVIQIATPAKQDVEEMPKSVTPKPIAEEKEVVKQEPVKPAAEEKQVKSEPVKPVAADTLAKKTNEPATTVKNEKEEPAKQPAPPNIAVENKPLADAEKKTVAEPVVAQHDAAAAVVKTDNQPAVVKTKPAEPEKPKAVEPEKKTETSNKLVMINSDCVKLATDNDVDKLRVKMLPENDLQKKLAIANKSFKTMCLYAKHIKALSELFPTDEAKYQFLEMAYPFAADTANFKALHELLTEDIYITKFKKLVRLQ